MRAIVPKLDGREKLVCKSRTNEASMMIVGLLIDGGGVTITFHGGEVS